MQKKLKRFCFQYAATATATLHPLSTSVLGGGGGEVGGEGEVLIGRSPLHSKRLFEATPSGHQPTDVSTLLAVCVSVFVCVCVCVCVRERER
jgi:hypothetical protein